MESETINACVGITVSSALFLTVFESLFAMHYFYQWLLICYYMFSNAVKIFDTLIEVFLSFNGPIFSHMFKCI